MRSVKELRRKAASRVSRKARVYSTSEARANFAEALETAQVDNAVIGFDRYGRTIAALVPVEAIYMLAGKGNMIAPSVREEIESFSLQFIQSVPSRVAAVEPAGRSGAKRAKKAAPKKKKAKSKRGGKRSPRD
jgi:hypothetical protein